MYRNFMPILAILIISGGAQQSYAADTFSLPQVAHKNGLSCPICSDNHFGDDLLLDKCNNHLVAVHLECMREWMRQEPGNIRCPQCFQDLSEENLTIIAIAEERRHRFDERYKKAFRASFSAFTKAVQSVQGSGSESDRIISKAARKHEIISNETQCTICMDNLNNNDQVIKTLPCTHAFHTACINTWLKQNPTCPVCRS